MMAPPCRPHRSRNRPTARPAAGPLWAAALVLGFAPAACIDLEAHIVSEPHRGLALPPADAPDAVELDGLHNVVTYAPGYVSGGVPNGRDGLMTLATMGVKTVVSVDGATPDVDTAEEFGMRYVHLPISYDEVPAERRRELAQVLINCEAPIYVHCYHGRHRSAAALGAAGITAGKLDHTTAESRMGISGTSQNYPGLWQSLHDSSPLEAAALRADPATFPSVTRVTGLVATMSELDVGFDHVKEAHTARWQTPDDHPDLVPTHATRRLFDLLAGLPGEAESQKLPQDYRDQVQQIIADSEALAAAVGRGDHTAADRQFELVRKGCKACHADYRNR